MSGSGLDYFPTILPPYTVIGRRDHNTAGPTEAIPIDQLLALVPATVSQAPFNTTAALLSAFGAGVVLTDGTIFVTGGRSNPGDTPGVTMFRYIASPTWSADDGGAHRVDAQGRHFQYIGDILPVELYGAVVGSSATAQIQAALDYGKTTGQEVTLGNSEFTSDGTLTWDISKHRFSGRGVRLFCQNNHDHTSLVLTCSGTDPSTIGIQNSSHPMDGITLVGPDQSSSSDTSIGIATAPLMLVGPWIHNFVARNGGITGFNQQLVVGNGWFDNLFDNFNMGGVSGSAPNYLGTIASGANNGERLCYRNQQFFNYIKGGFYITMVGDHYYDQCSFDGDAYAVDMEAAGIVNFNLCHGENLNTDKGAMFIAGVADALLLFNGGSFSSDVARSSELFLSNATGGSFNTSGVVLNGTKIGIAHAYSPIFLVGGVGPVRANGITWGGNSAKIPLSYAANLFQDGRFQAAAALNDWTPSGTWTIDTGVGSGVPFTTGLGNTTTSVRSNASSGTNTLVSSNFPCLPGAAGYDKRAGRLHPRIPHWRLDSLGH